MSTKKKIREQIYQQWKILSVQKKKELALCALKEIAKIKEFLSAAIIFIYAPEQDKEVYFVKELMELYPRKKYAFPRITNDKMEFFRIKNYNNLVLGKFDILTPPTGSAKISQADFCFVPAVACDLNKYRLGRGKGYYDKFLQKNNTYKICILPQFALLKKLPIDSFDIPVDSVIALS